LQKISDRTLLKSIETLSFTLFHGSGRSLLSCYDVVLVFIVTANSLIGGLKSDL